MHGTNIENAVSASSLMPTKRLNIYDAIWYQFYDLKNAKNDHGEALLLVRLQELAHFNVFFAFFKLYKWYKIAQSFSFSADVYVITLNMLVLLNNSG